MDDTLDSKHQETKVTTQATTRATTQTGAEVIPSRMATPQTLLRRCRNDDQQQEDWLVTFADLATLLMIFFIIMYAVTGLSKEELEDVSNALQEQGFSNHEDAPFNPLSPTGFGEMAGENPFEKTTEALEDTLISYGFEGFAQVQTKPGSIEVELVSSSFFAPGGAEFRQEAVGVLSLIAGQLKPVVKEGMQVKIEGHTDDVPIHSAQFPSNWELSTARASSVVRFLIAHGLPETALVAMGYADSRPKVANKDATGEPIPENRAINRRVVITISQSAP